MLPFSATSKTKWNIGFHISPSALAPAPSADAIIRQRVALLFHNMIRRRPPSLHMQPLKVTGSPANRRCHIQAPMQRHHGKGGPSMAAVCLICACSPDSTSTPSQRHRRSTQYQVLPGTVCQHGPIAATVLPPIPAGLSNFSDRGGGDVLRCIWNSIWERHLA